MTKDWPEPDVPQDLATALVAAPQKIQNLWNEITPMARWEWVRWVDATKNPDTRRRRVDVSISKMQSGKRRPCCFNLSACTTQTCRRTAGFSSQATTVPDWRSDEQSQGPGMRRITASGSAPQIRRIGAHFAAGSRRHGVPASTGESRLTASPPERATGRPLAPPYCAFSEDRGAEVNPYGFAEVRSA